MTTKNALLEVTARLFAESGWRGTTTRKIAEAAGVNEVTLFRHFGSKEVLLRAAIERSAAIGPMTALPEEPAQLRKEITAWASVIHAHVVQQGPMIRGCLAEFEEHPDLAPVSCDGPMQAMQAMVRYLTRARELELISGSASLEGATVMLMNAIFLDAITRDVVPTCNAMSASDAVAVFVDLILRALGAREAV
jgi:AcrR family transcriptional regulator